MIILLFYQVKQPKPAPSDGSFFLCCLVPRGVLYFTTKLANFIMSVLNNQKELGGQQRCPMGLVGNPVDCRTQMMVVHTPLAVLPALKLDLLALRVHVG